MYGINLWSPMLPSGLGSCRNDISPEEGGFPKYSPFGLSPPMIPVTNSGTTQMMPVGDSLSAVTTAPHLTFFGQNFATGIPQSLFCGIPFPTSSSSQESFHNSLRQKDGLAPGAFKPHHNSSSSNDERDGSGSSDTCECPICHEVLENGNMRRHFLEELEELYSKESKLAVSATGNTEDNNSEIEAIQSSASKSRYEHFLHIRNNRMRRIHGRSNGRKRKSPSFSAQNNDSPTESYQTTSDYSSIRLDSEESEKCSDAGQDNAFGDGKASKFDFRGKEEDVDVTENISDRYGISQYSDTDVTNSEFIKKARMSPNSPNHGSAMSCPKCANFYTNPLVSVQCWHVMCEQCWMEVLRTRKLCPSCKSISSSEMLRKIYL